MPKGSLGAFLGAGIWSPGILIVITLALYMLPVGTFGPNTVFQGVASATNQWPVLYAVLIVGFGLFVFSLLGHDRGLPSQANAQNYMDLHTRLERLKKLPLSTDKKHEAAVNEINAHIAGVEALLKEENSSAGDTRWISAAGYIEAYRRLMRAEEGYIEASPDDQHAIRVALHDWLRLKGSGMKDEDTLLKKLGSALWVISKANAIDLGVKDPRLSSANDGQDGKVQPLTDDQARADLREIDYAINEFRSDRWSGIIRARNKLAVTTVVFGLVGYALLAFAIAVLPAPQPGQSSPVIVGLVFYLVGAVSGLFGQLRLDVQADTAIDDYGLSIVRIAQTPLSSGLAAVLGVLVVKLAADTNVKLEDLFDLTKNPNELLIAAALGLSPQVVIGRLTEQADKYKSDLKKSTAGDGTGEDSKDTGKGAA